MHSIVFKSNIFLPLPSSSCSKNSHLPFFKPSRIKKSVKVCKCANVTHKVIHVPKPLNFNVHSTTNIDYLKAASALRALTFCTYPSDRSSESIKRHQHMRAEEEFQSVKCKIKGLLPAFPRVECLVAICSDLDPVSNFDFPYAIIQEGKETEWVIGTLDINLGIRLPGESLAGFHPQVDADKHRAYLSNVCVAEPMRRRGVARQLISKAKEIASEWSVKDLYVHVVVDNHGAIEVYKNCGFVFEQEESATVARNLQRPRRLLLHWHVQ